MRLRLQESAVLACFINSVEDSLGFNSDAGQDRGMLFKWARHGTNLSSIRGSMENLSGAGRPLAR